jgi:ribosomal protein L21E
MSVILPQTKTRSMLDYMNEQYDKHHTKSQTYADFKVGDSVMVITPCQDFQFFTPYYTWGRIVKNKGRYLSIVVFLFDSKRNEYTVWGFEPKDLISFGNRYDKKKQNILEKYFLDKEFSYGDREGMVVRVQMVTLLNTDMVYLEVDTDLAIGLYEMMFRPLMKYLSVSVIAVDKPGFSSYQFITK